MARERISPKDGKETGDRTRGIWRSNCRVQEYDAPQVSSFELQELFGADASFTTHGDQRLPYDCGANKYTLVEDDPFVLECTERGLFTTSGPSGTAYRYLNLWLVLGGSRERLLELQLAITSLMLGGYHHSMIEVMAVCAPILQQGMPRSQRCCHS